MCALQTRSAVVYHALYPLDMRKKHAKSALGVRDASADELTTNTRRAFRGYLALAWRTLCVSGVRLRASSSTHNFEYAQKLSTHATHDIDDARCRWPSALDERATNA